MDLTVSHGGIGALFLNFPQYLPVFMKIESSHHPPHPYFSLFNCLYRDQASTTTVAPTSDGTPPKFLLLTLRFLLLTASVESCRLLCCNDTFAQSFHYILTYQWNIWIHPFPIHIHLQHHMVRFLCPTSISASVSTSVSTFISAFVSSSIYVFRSASVSISASLYQLLPLSLSLIPPPFLPITSDFLNLPSPMEMLNFIQFHLWYVVSWFF